MVGFINNLAQMIFLTKRCVWKEKKQKQVDSSKVKVYNESLLYLADNFVMNSEISKLYGKNCVAYKDHVASLKAKVTIQTMMKTCLFHIHTLGLTAK